MPLTFGELADCFRATTKRKVNIYLTNFKLAAYFICVFVISTSHAHCIFLPLSSLE